MKNKLFFPIICSCYFVLVQCSFFDKCPSCTQNIEKAELALSNEKETDYKEVFGAYNNAYTEANKCGSDIVETTHRSKQQFEKLATLKKLDLTDFTAKSLDKELSPGLFVGLDNLQELDLSHNAPLSFQTGVFKGLKKLQKLKSNFNFLYQLDKDIFQDQKQLQHLDLGCNYLSNLDKDIFKGLDSLQYLSLLLNRLNDLDKEIFKGLVHLKTLELSLNRLTILDKDIFDGLNHLQKLNLSNNPLTYLDKDIFQGLSNLQKLNLSSTNIKNISSINHLPALELLDIQHCANLSQLPNEIAELKKLRYIFVHESGLSPTEIERVKKLVPWAEIVTTLESDNMWEQK